MFGPRLGQWTGQITRRWWTALVGGMGVALVAPSSTTMSALAVDAVRSRGLSCRTILTMMFGAEVGLTMMVVLIAFRIDQYAPALVAIGVLLFQFMQRPIWRGVGQVVLSLGFIFLGVGTIKTIAHTFDPAGDLAQLFELASGHPILLTVLAMVMAVSLQSSTATIALAMGLGAAGVVDLPLVVAVVCGANVGVGLTTLMMGWSMIEARRFGVALLIGKITIAVVMLMLLPHVVSLLSLWQSDSSVDVQAAMMHVLFNVSLATLGLILLSPLVWLAKHVAPEPTGEAAETFGPRHLNRLPASGGSGTSGVTLALGQSLREINHVAEIVRSMLDDLWRAMEVKSETLVREVSLRDDRVDLLHYEIQRFLTRLLEEETSSEDAHEQLRQLRYLTELEVIGDIIDRNLSELILRKIRMRVVFDREDSEAVDEMYRMVFENMLIADEAFNRRDRVLAKKLHRHKERIGEFERTMRDRHYARLSRGGVAPDSSEATAMPLDLLLHLKSINSHITHVAYAVLGDEEPR